MLKQKILITGGAGFIGSHLVDYFINLESISVVRILDNLSTGLYSNLIQHEGNIKFEFIEGDICDYQTCLDATIGIDKVLHHAALGSVPRSIENPIKSAEVNIMGSFNLFYAAVINKVDRMILACSSSTYGDSPQLPKVENVIGNPLSPYALTKLCLEQTAEIFNRTYGLNYIGLRYFNIFGPRQRPDSEYAAVIPKFCAAFSSGESPHINGDGSISRDFTYIDNVVLANSLSIFTSNKKDLNQIYNTACGESITLNEIIDQLNFISNKNIKPNYLPNRKGDVLISKADISKISQHLNYSPLVKFDEGLRKTYNWFITNYNVKI